MVNRGRSGGCMTCRRRRVKCDEAKPDCQRCIKFGTRCEGYDRPPVRLRFRDESQKLAAKASRQHVQQRSESHSQSPPPSAMVVAVAAASMPSPFAYIEPDTSIDFFVTHYATAGRCLGVLEPIAPALAHASSSPGAGPAALPLVVSAVGQGLISVWHEGPAVLRRPYSETFNTALSAVRAAVRDPVERVKPATLLAIVVLQFYENIVSTFNRRRPSRTHFDGAVSLFPSAVAAAPVAPATADGHLRDVVRASIPRYLLQFEVRSALRTGRPLPDAAYAWLKDQTALATAAPPSPVAALDVIGAAVSGLQTSFIRLCSRPRSCPSFAARLAAWQLAVEGVDADLAAWAASLPCHWHPVWLRCPRDLHPSIPTYEGACDAYAACQIATAWNSWRLYGVALAKMKFALLGRQPVFLQDIQDLVDNICLSFPFYLGNRTRPTTVADFTDPHIHLPYHPSLETGPDGTFSRGGPAAAPPRHRHHVLAQGPWHVMGIMMWVLSLVSEDDMPPLLRPGQLDWIRGQFRRALVVMWLGGEDVRLEQTVPAGGPAPLEVVLAE